MFNKEAVQLKYLAQSWNNLNTSYLEPVLSENVIYDSQWVLTPIKGKIALLAHLKAKFTAIQNSIISEQMNVTAEMAICPSLQHRPCIILTQFSKNISRRVTILISIKEDKIYRIDICFIPDPASLKLTGEFPK